MLSSDFHCKENDERFGFLVVPAHPGLVTSDYCVHEVGANVESSMSEVYGYDPETKSPRHFPYNENPLRELNTTPLKCCLPSTNAIGGQEKFTHAYEGSRSPRVSAIL